MLVENPLKFKKKCIEYTATRNSISFIYRNVTSLNKNRTFIQADENFMNDNIMVFIEMWTLYNNQINSSTFNILACYDCTRPVRKPPDSIIYWNKHRQF